MPDEERPLTERGERQARTAGLALAMLGVRLDAVLTSPRVRALETARLTCEAFDERTESAVHAPLSAGFDGAQALSLLAAWPEDAHVMIVGHEPDLAGLIGDLTGARVKLKKGGIAMIDVSSAVSGELVLLVRPRELALIAGVAVSQI